MLFLRPHITSFDGVFCHFYLFGNLNKTPNPLFLPQVLLQASPYITFGQVAVNCCILEASSGAEKLHIVDFGVGHGLHWDPLMKALSSRPGGAPSLRITGVDLPAPTGNRAYCLIETGARLKVSLTPLNFTNKLSF